MAGEVTARSATRRKSGPAIPRPNVMVCLAIVPALIIIGLLALVVGVSFREDVINPELTFRHYASLYTDSFVYTVFLNTVGFALISLFVALLFGVSAAWLVERTDLPGKTIVSTAMVLGVLIPGFFTAMGWIFLLHPRIGMVNQAAMNLLGLSSTPISIVSIPGMGWVQGLSLGAVVFVMTSAGLRAMDSSLEESARMSGATFFDTLRRITLPLAFPSLLASALYTLTIGVAAFDVPLIIGLSNRIFTFSTFLYFKTNPMAGMPEYGVPAAFSSFMIILALLLSWWYGRVLAQARKYQVITGKNYKPKQIALGRWWIVAWLFLGGYILLSKILPLLVLMWAAVLPYFQPPSLDALQAVSLRHFHEIPWPLVTRGLSNTLILMIGAPTLALAFSLILSWVVLRSRNRFRFAFDFIAFLPHAVPHIIFGLAAMLAALFIIRGPVDLYGTVTLLLIVYAIVQISFGTRVVNGALIQIHTELEEAAYTAGASLVDVLRRVVIPLLKPAFVYGWLWLAMLTFRELTLATILFSSENITLSRVVWSLWNAGKMAQASLVTLLMMGCLLPLILIYWRFTGGLRAQR